MNKKTIFNEIQKELNKLNDQIDTKIIKGYPYAKEARRHKSLIATLRRIDREKNVMKLLRRSRVGRSPVRRRLNGGATSRLLPWNFA